MTHFLLPLSHPCFCSFTFQEKDTQRLVDLLQASLVILPSQEEEGLSHRPFYRIWGNCRGLTEVKTGALFKALVMWAFSMPRTCWGWGRVQPAAVNWDKEEEVIPTSFGEWTLVIDTLGHSFNKDLLICIFKNVGTSLVVQWLRLRAPIAWGPGLTSGNQIPHDVTEGSHAAVKDPACSQEDQRSHVLPGGSEVPRATTKTWHG